MGFVFSFYGSNSFIGPSQTCKAEVVARRIARERRGVKRGAEVRAAVFAPWGCAFAEGLIRRFPAQEPAFRLAPIGKYEQPGKAQVGAARAVEMARGARGRKRPQKGKTGVREAVWGVLGPENGKNRPENGIFGSKWPRNGQFSGLGGSCGD